MTTLDDHRTIQEDDGRHQAEPVSQAEGIRWCQQALQQLAPTDNRFDEHAHVGPGDCHECSRPTLILRTLGQYDLCVDCLLRRLNAHAKSTPSVVPVAA